MRLKDGSASEYAIQKAVFDYIKTQPALRGLIIHIPNEGKRHPRTGKALRDIGLTRGVFDILITLPNHGYHAAWIELKSQKGVLSLYQHEFKQLQQKFGYFTAVCHDVEEAIQTIEWYCYGN